MVLRETSHKYMNLSVLTIVQLRMLIIPIMNLLDTEGQGISYSNVLLSSQTQQEPR
jgi:hypothetical protein